MPVQLQINGETLSSTEDINEVFKDMTFDSSNLPRQIKLIKVNNQVRRLQTIIRDKYVFTVHLHTLVEIILIEY